MDATKQEIGLAVGVSAIYGFGQSADENHKRWLIVDTDGGYARRAQAEELNDFGYHGLLTRFGLDRYADQLPLKVVREMSCDELANWCPALAH